jgi:hypothetical protein
MRFDEAERIGKQQCTPFEYALPGVGYLVGFVAPLMLLATPMYLSMGESPIIHPNRSMNAERHNG